MSRIVLDINAEAGEPRSTWAAMKRGAAGRCPACGRGRLFSGFLKVADGCGSCGTAFHHHRADDLPAYIAIFLVGHVVVAGFLLAERAFDWPDWLHALVWMTATLALSLLLIGPAKGAVVGLQWAQRMHGFGSERIDGDEHPALRPREEPRA